ncbi:MAG: malto-oligosyltrehalose synthase [Candidatus Obscuribacterales bacterium]|nr:malto-oligosyltrehalose synthase [Candidatus Obscuribacterales bacterium]
MTPAVPIFEPFTLNQKTWGVHLRLSSLKSKRNWGVGDFTDLKNFVLWAKSKHAGLIELEPLQTIDTVEDWNEAQIAFSSRSFINPVYIDVEVVPDFIESEDIQRHILAPDFQLELTNLRQEKTVDFVKAKLHKLSALQLCYQHFREHHLALQTARAIEFREFQQAQGAPLKNYALFRALREKLEPPTVKAHGWRNWPEAYRTIDGAGTIEFAEANLERIEYFEYLQWTADAQLTAVQSICLEIAAPVELLIQLPQSINPSGADAWLVQDETESSFACDEEQVESKFFGNIGVIAVNTAEQIETLSLDQSDTLLLNLLSFSRESSDKSSRDWRVKTAVDMEAIQDDVELDKVSRELSKLRPLAPAVAKAAVKTKSVAVLPQSTYRFQFNKEFKFTAAIELVPYLAQLGVTHCYSSPFMKARPGSMHGYDIIDHKKINPEIGTPEELDQLVAKLKEYNLGLILDIVPNHMGIGMANRWWMDVLENGPASIFAEYFDIDWFPVKPELYGKVTLPVLGESYGAVLKGGQLKLSFVEDDGALFVKYYDNAFPVNPKTYPKVLANRMDVLKERLGKNNADVMEYESIITALDRLPAHTEKAGFNSRVREKEVQMKRLAALCKVNREITTFIEQNLLEFEVRLDDSHALDRMHSLLEAQAYRLVFWRVASDEINYRRFFDINELAAVRTEDPRVFAEMHELVFNLIAEGKLDGLRIDHPDGLFDPYVYFNQLQIKAAEKLNKPTPGESDLALGKETLPFYIIVEKILAPFEHLEDDWAVHGTVGYDFLNSLQNVFIASENESSFKQIYETFIGRSVEYEELKTACKGLILDTVLASELYTLAHRLSQIAEMSWNYRDFTLNSLRKALRYVVMYFPVYRSYVTPRKVDKVAKQYIDWSIRLAKRHGKSVTPEVFDFLRSVLCLEATESPTESMNEELASQFQAAIQTFAMKVQQFTSPVMAKSVEDTLFYRFNRFVALNEVGGEPDRFGISVSSFHHQNQQRQQRRSFEMLATSTHDTKRSEDVRARLCVLSELPLIWEQKTALWARQNKSRKTVIDEEQLPDANDEYLIYQTLVGVCPLETEGTDWVESLKKRVIEYMLKAARESKSHTSWINQNTEYENALTSFMEKILTVSQTNPFFDDFVQFQKVVAQLGLINSLSQTVLKFTSPGVPDIYQGNEVFDFSLVDPDNRRAVDYEHRQRMLHEVQSHLRDHASQPNFIETVIENFGNGQSKLLVTAAALSVRQNCADLFTKGRYIPLEVQGTAEANVVAFAREYNGNWSITVVPRLVASLLHFGETLDLADSAVIQKLLSGKIWGDTAIVLPTDLLNSDLCNVLTGQRWANIGATLRVGDVLKQFPVAILAKTTGV